MREIPLTQGKVALVDGADFDLVAQFCWHAFQCRPGASWYARRNSPEIIGNHSQRMHQLLCPQWKRIDHADGDGLNNQRLNLRAATTSLNRCNAGKAKGKTSQYLRVCWNKQEGCWRSEIRVNGKLILIGYFDNEREAAVASDQAAIKFFGGYARLNFPRL